MIAKKQHLTIYGLNQIVGFKASMNLGLSDHLCVAGSFPNVVPAIRPLVVNQLIANPQWLSGFASAEGCFFIGINKSSTTKTKVNIQLEFQLTQHIRDELLIQSLPLYAIRGPFRSPRGPYFIQGSWILKLWKCSSK